MPSDRDLDLDIRTASPADIAALVALQMRALQGSIVTDLGPAFLTRFHTAALEQPSTRAFVARAGEGPVAGFLLASTDLAAFNRQVKSRVRWSVVKALLAPRALRYALGFVRNLAEAEPRPLMPATLLLLFVDSSVRRRGVARRLLATLHEVLAAEGATRYRVAVRKHLADAQAFYLAEGFEVEQEVAVLGRPMICLTKRVSGVISHPAEQN